MFLHGLMRVVGAGGIETAMHAGKKNIANELVNFQNHKRCTKVWTSAQIVLRSARLANFCFWVMRCCDVVIERS